MTVHHRSSAPIFTALAVAALSLSAQAQSTGPGPGPVATPPGPGIGYPTPTDPAARGTGMGSVTAPGGTAAPMPSSPTRTSAYGGSVGTAGTSAYGRDAYSLIPYTRRGYVGLNLGTSEYKRGCGSGGYACDDSELSGYLYTGGMFNDWFGTEIGYVNTGKADRSGGATRSQGVNLSLVARAPLGPVNLFAKVGALYGESRVSSGFLSDVQEGKARGWGASYAAGVGFDFTPTSGVVLEWSRNEFRFPGAGRQDVDSTSVGYIHRF